MFPKFIEDCNRLLPDGAADSTSCRRAAATICPAQACNRSAHRQPWARPAEPDPISQYAPSSRPAAYAARRPDERDRRQTDGRQTASSLNAPARRGGITRCMGLCAHARVSQQCLYEKCPEMILKKNNSHLITLQIWMPSRYHVWKRRMKLYI